MGRGMETNDGDEIYEVGGCWEMIAFWPLKDGWFQAFWQFRAVVQEVLAGREQARRWKIEEWFVFIARSFLLDLIHVLSNAWSCWAECANPGVVQFPEPGTLSFFRSSMAT